MASLKISSKPHLRDIHLFRGLTIIIIVSSHILYADRDSVFYRIISSIFLNSTLFFAFVSGYLFQYLSEKYEYKSYLRRKAKYVILPYLIVSVPALVLRIKSGPDDFIYAIFPEFAEYSIPIQILAYLVTGSHLLPMWYLPMIALFFLAAPIFRLFDVYPKLFFLFPIVLVLPFIFPRDSILILFNPFRMALHFLPIYLAGILYCKYQIKIETHLRNYFSWLAMLLVILLIASILSPIDIRHHIIFIQKLVMLAILLIFLKQPRIESGLISRFADLSFGIYFVHFYIILVLRKLNYYIFGFELPTNIISWLIFFLIVLTLSFISTWTMKKIFGNESRLLIGS